MNESMRAHKSVFCSTDKSIFPSFSVQINRDINNGTIYNNIVIMMDNVY